MYANLITRRRILTGRGGGGGFSLPYSIDFSTLGDGALPAPWVGATWAISSGKAVNTPTLGSELVIDGDMEMVGVANWADYNAPTTKEKNTTAPLTGTQDLHIVTDGGSKGARQVVASVPAGLYILSANHKVTSGRAQVPGGAGSFQQYCIFNSDAATKTKGSCSVLLQGVTNYYVWLAANQAMETNFDDVSFSECTTPRTYINAQRADVIVSANCTLSGSASTGQSVGVSLNWDTGGENGVDCYIDRDSGTAKIKLVKWLSGIPTLVMNETITYVADQAVRAEKSGTTYVVKYNGSQIGSDQTISDAAIVSNTYIGLFNSGGGSSQSVFFCSTN